MFVSLLASILAQMLFCTNCKKLSTNEDFQSRLKSQLKCWEFLCAQAGWHSETLVIAILIGKTVCFFNPVFGIDKPSLKAFNLPYFKMFFFFLLLFFETGRVSLCRPDWPQTQDPQGLSLPTGRITDMKHYALLNYPILVCNPTMLQRWVILLASNQVILSKVIIHFISINTLVNAY
jgi:hypothetical protein